MTTNLHYWQGMSEALITPYGSSQLVPSTTRTNTAAWLDFNQNELVARIEGKLAEATGTLPVCEVSASMYSQSHDFADCHFRQSTEPRWQDVCLSKH